jgi:hypothetical protein
MYYCLSVVLVTTKVTIVRFTLTPTTAVVCFKWVMTSGSIILYMILHGLHSACYCGRGGNHHWVYPLSQLLMPWFYHSRSLVGGVLYLTCIPSFWLDDRGSTTYKSSRHLFFSLTGTIVFEASPKKLAIWHGNGFV